MWRLSTLHDLIVQNLRSPQFATSTLTLVQFTGQAGGQNALLETKRPWRQKLTAPFRMLGGHRPVGVVLEGVGFGTALFMQMEHSFSVRYNA